MVEPRILRQVLAYYPKLLEFSQRYLRVPGIQAAVYGEGEVLWSGAFGNADLETGTALTDSHLFRIASHSKTVTATAVLQLAERAQLRLDDTAATHVPELTDTPLGAVTVRDLLGHTAGVIQDGADADWWQLVGEFPDREELLKILSAAESAVVPPNERFKYSNIGYGLLGLVVESVVDSKYAEYVRTEIIDPLGLHDFGPEFDPARSADFAVGYSSLAYADRRVPIEHVDTRALAASAGAYANAADLVRFYAAHLPGDDRLLTDASKQLMQEGLQQTRIDDSGQRYGLGFSVVRIGDRDWVGHGGGYPGHVTRTLADPERGVIVAVLTNAIDGPAVHLAESFAKLLDLAVAQKPEPTQVERFAGRYANLRGITDVVPLGDCVYLLDPSQADAIDEAILAEVVDASTLRLVGKSGYCWYGEPLSFEFDALGNVLSMRGPSGGTRWPLPSFHLPDRVALRHL